MAVIITQGKHDNDPLYWNDTNNVITFRQLINKSQKENVPIIMDLAIGKSVMRRMEDIYNNYLCLQRTIVGVAELDSVWLLSPTEEILKMGFNIDQTCIVTDIDVISKIAHVHVPIGGQMITIEERCENLKTKV